MLTHSFKIGINIRVETFILKIDRKIVSYGILPKLKVEILVNCWDKKMFAIENLCKEELLNYASYHAFNIKKEDASVSLRGKRYLYDNERVQATEI